MKLLVKLIVGTVLVAITALFAVVIAVLLFVDPNDYRDEIAAVVERETGRTLSIEGELGLALLPCCGLRLEQTSLSNPPGFDTPQFARVERVRLGLAIWPLLTEQALVIGDVDLQGLDVELIRRADGRDNWTFTLGEPAAEDVEDEQAADGASSLSIAGINVGDARLVYRDAIDKLDYRLEELNLETGRVEPGQPFDLSASFRFEDAAAGITAQTAIDGVARFDLEAEAAGLDDARVELALAGQGLPADTVTLQLKFASAGYALDTGNAKVTAIEGDLGLAGARDMGAEAADLELQLDSLQYEGAAETVRLAGVTASVQAKGGDLPADGLTADVTIAGLDYGLANEAITLRELAADARGAGATLRVTGAGKLNGRGDGLRGAFELPALSPRKTLANLGQTLPETQDPKVLSRLSASGGWAFSADALALDGLSAQLDDTSISGDLAVNNFASPRVKIALALDAIDLDRYLEPASEEEAGDEADAAATELPREELRDLYLDGTLSIGRLLLAGLQLTDVKATARARDGVLTLQPLTAQLYRGRYEGSIRVDGSGEQTRVDLKQSLDAVQVGGLLADLADVEQLDGLVVANIDVSGSGRTDADLRESLAGSISFELADGIYKGLDIWHEIRKVRALTRREPPPARTGPPQTQISALDFGGRLADGTLKSQRMVAQIPFLRVTGNGAMNLADESLDYRFDARVLGVPEFPDGERLKDLEGWSIPLTLGGTLEDPKLGVDLAAFARSRAGQELQKKLFEKLGLDDKDEEPAPAEAPTEAPTEGDGQAPAQPEESQPEQQQEEQRQPPSPEDLLKRGLEDLFGR